MTKKKTLLVLLLVVSLALMLVIVYFIKTKFGYFGDSYHQYIENIALNYDTTVETNMSRINSEIKYLSSDKLVKSVFESSSRGEDTEKYFDDFDKIRNSIPECQKLQILDSIGNIIFSVETNEINNIRIVRPIMASVRDHLSTNDFTYIYLLNKDSLAAFYNVAPEISSTTNGGYVVIYYKMSKLFAGISSGQIVADGAISNMLITSKISLNNNNVNYLLNYMKNPEMYKKIEKNEKSVFVVRKNIHGIEVLYYPSNERPIPVIGWIALVACLLFFILVVIALIMIMRDEKLISDMPIKPVNINIHEEGSVEKPDEIKTLINDIEGNKLYEEKEAKKSIEDMIMSNGINLTEAFPVAEDENIALKDDIYGPDTKIEIAEPSMISEDGGIDTFESVKPTKQTDLFAEEERILSNIESQVPHKEESSVKIGDLGEEDEFMLNESFNESEFPVFDVPAAEEQVAFEAPAIPEIKEVRAEEPMIENLPEDIMMEPPQKISSILTVEDYGKLAIDLAKNSLNINKILILEKHENEYIPIIKEGLAADNFKIMPNDPIFTMFLSGGKGLDIKGRIYETRYFMERFKPEDIRDIDEVFITPIIKNKEITGIAIYLKQQGIHEPTHFQKSELLNLSFLQDQ